MLVTHVLHIDLTKPGFQPVVAAVQGEANTRQLTVSLFCNSVAWDIPEGATAAVAFLKPDGTKGLYDKLPNGSPATTMSGNTVTAILAPQALTCAGTVLASVVFYDQDLDTLATFPFRITVEKNPAAGEQISNNYYALQNLDQVNEAYTDLLSRVESLEKNGGGSGSVSEDQLAAAVEAYFAEHPVSGGSTLRVAEILLRASKWLGEDNLYWQAVPIDGVTPYSQVDLNPSVYQLAIFHDKDLSFVTENEGGVVTVYAIGQKPENDYTMQVTIKEVSV